MDTNTSMQHSGSYIYVITLIPYENTHESKHVCFDKREFLTAVISYYRDFCSRYFNLYECKYMYHTKYLFLTEEIDDIVNDPLEGKQHACDIKKIDELPELIFEHMSISDLMTYLNSIIKKMNSFDIVDEGVWLNVEMYTHLRPI